MLLNLVLKRNNSWMNGSKWLKVSASKQKNSTNKLFNKYLMDPYLLCSRNLKKLGMTV